MKMIRNLKTKMKRSLNMAYNGKKKKDNGKKNK